jgi:hypothetical protein
MAKKKPPFTPIVGDPLSAANFGQEASSLFDNFKSSIGLLKEQRKLMRGQGQVQRQDIRRQGRENMWGTVGASQERGVLGSSQDVAARAAVRGDTAAQIIAARDALKQGMVANYSQQMQARREYETGFLNLQQMRAAAKSGSAMEDYLAGLLDEQGGGGGRGRNPGNKRQEVLLQRLADRRGNIQDTLDQLRGLATGGISLGEADEVERLRTLVREEWKRRNKVLGKLDRKKQKRSKLENKLQGILSPASGVGTGVSL